MPALLRIGGDRSDRGETLAVEVSCSDDALTVVLDDGRTVSVPIVWFPLLLNATSEERNDWELISGGLGIHWEAIDEDISVASLLRPEKFMRLPDPALRRAGADGRSLASAISRRDSPFLKLSALSRQLSASILRADG